MIFTIAAKTTIDEIYFKWLCMRILTAIHITNEKQQIATHELRERQHDESKMSYEVWNSYGEIKLCNPLAYFAKFI